MSKHTAGPWRIKNSQILEDRQARKEKIFGYDRVLATLPSWHLDNERELQANGRVMTLAPELLSVAIEAAMYLKASDFGPVSREILGRLNEVIAKAEGEEK